ncbi:MAG TPA: DNA polymerase III subunit delta [Pseudonocardia sp.]|nr:DNA polymerase III subunit delta [Pseudonocardia sp.]
MRAGDVLGRVTLVTGKEEFLNERTVAAVREAVLGHDAEAEVSETEAAGLGGAGLGELGAPSLFSSIRCVVLRALEGLPEESVDGLLAYAADPSDDVALVLVHGGGPKGSGVLTKLRKLPAVSESKSSELRASEIPGFVTAEVRRHGATIDSEAAAALVQSVGQDLRSLSAAAHQLASDFPRETLTLDLVKRYFGGRAEAKSFAVADAAFSGRREVALEELRWALDAGTAPVLVTSAFAGSARGLARFRGAPRGQRDADLAREVGVPPWKLRTIRVQARDWSDAGLSRAIRAVAQADADIKGAASDPSYTLERLVLTVAGLRTPKND